MKNPFFDKKEEEIIERFLENGYVIFPIENLDALANIRKNIFNSVGELLNLKSEITEKNFFDKTQDYVPIEKLNTFRVSLIAAMARTESLRPQIYSLARNHLHWIVGNELAMQRACNLSIQLPKDDSSLLPLHCDTWQGNSPFEMVFWLPLVDCYKTKSMYILPRNATDEIVKNFSQYSKLSVGELYKKFQSRLVSLDVPFGHGLIFSHAMLHGNNVNEEADARWSMNIRFKPLLSPYGSKELGESFLPITLRPATRFGYSIKPPELR